LKGYTVVRVFVDDDMSAYSGKTRPTEKRLPKKLTDALVVPCPSFWASVKSLRQRWICEGEVSPGIVDGIALAENCHLDPKK
jgi:hypothetical protein